MAAMLSNGNQRFSILHIYNYCTAVSTNHSALRVVGNIAAEHTSPIATEERGIEKFLANEGRGIVKFLANEGRGLRNS